MDKIRIIHVGLGGWGGNWATHVLPGHPDVEVVGYADISAEKREIMAARLHEPKEKFFPLLDDALTAVDADAVTIAVPVAFHEPVARLALEAGKHVVVEKPFTQTLQQAQGLVDLAESRRLVLAVSQNYRFYPAAQMVADLASRGYFGRVVGGKIDFRRNAVAERSGNINWPHPMLADMAVHHYDLMRMVIGEDPVEVTARSWNPIGSPYREDAAAAMVLTFSGGATISYRGSWVDPGPQTAWGGEWQLDFERASVLWTSRGDQPWQAKRDMVQILRPNAQLEDVALPPYPLHDRAGVLAAFAQTLRTGGEPPFFPSGRANLGTLSTIEAALKSAANGGASVRLDSIV
ncbi:MAG TPA: Gfo/Idh/MocA family oxidoreductase [Devosiaceae bacterium]|nr:Gfo/Idh/MocA family oxidoreductase [Devosiaceae bacterium]